MEGRTHTANTDHARELADTQASPPMLVSMAWRLLPVVSLLVYGAHYLRQGRFAVIAAVLALGILLVSRWAWIRLVVTAALLSMAAHWGVIAWDIAARRLAEGGSSSRLLVILGALSLFTGASAVPFCTSRLRERYKKSLLVAPSASFILTFLLLATVIVVVDRPLLLLGRFVPEGDWLEAIALSTYAAWLTPKLLDAKQSAKWRARAWWLFSVVFFTQFILGLAGFDVFVMTPGKVHLPIPALILAGPLYRGEGYFMLILFASSLLLVGPASCSHLCYIGTWDNWFSSRRKKPAILPSWRQRVRITITVMVMGAAVIMRLPGVAPLPAGVAAIAFGLAGVAVMAWSSSRTGTMAYCVTYCPIGLAATKLGRLSPFRLKISSACTLYQLRSLHTALPLQCAETNRYRKASTWCIVHPLWSLPGALPRTGSLLWIPWPERTDGPSSVRGLGRCIPRSNVGPGAGLMERAACPNRADTASPLSPPPPSDALPSHLGLANRSKSCAKTDALLVGSGVIAEARKRLCAEPMKVLFYRTADAWSARGNLGETWRGLVPLGLDGILLQNPFEPGIAGNQEIHVSPGQLFGSLFCLRHLVARRRRANEQ